MLVIIVVAIELDVIVIVEVIFVNGFTTDGIIAVLCTTVLMTGGDFCDISSDSMTAVVAVATKAVAAVVVDDFGPVDSLISGECVIPLVVGVGTTTIVLGSLVSSGVVSVNRITASDGFIADEGLYVVADGRTLFTSALPPRTSRGETIESDDTNC